MHRTMCVFGIVIDRFFKNHTTCGFAQENLYTIHRTCGENFGYSDRLRTVYEIIAILSFRRGRAMTRKKTNTVILRSKATKNLKGKTHAEGKYRDSSVTAFPQNDKKGKQHCHSEERSDEESKRKIGKIRAERKCRDSSVTAFPQNDKKRKQNCHSEERSDEESKRKIGKIRAEGKYRDSSVTVFPQNDKKGKQHCHSEERSDEESKTIIIHTILLKDLPILDSSFRLTHSFSREASLLIVFRVQLLSLYRSLFQNIPIYERDNVL